jgi:hypothetical protein
LRIRNYDVERDRFSAQDFRSRILNQSTDDDCMTKILTNADQNSRVLIDSPPFQISLQFSFYLFHREAGNRQWFSEDWVFK